MSQSTGFIGEVLVDREWCRNSLVFATRPEAEKYAEALWRAWLPVREFRVTQVSEVPNYRFIGPGQP